MFIFFLLINSHTRPFDSNPKIYSWKINKRPKEGHTTKTALAWIHHNSGRIVLIPFARRAWIPRFPSMSYVRINKKNENKALVLHHGCSVLPSFSPWNLHAVFFLHPQTMQLELLFQGFAKWRTQIPLCATYESFLLSFRPCYIEKESQ